MSKDKLKYRLRAEGVTQQQVADALGKSRCSVNKLLNGKRASMNDKEIKTLMELLNINEAAEMKKLFLD